MGYPVSGSRGPGRVDGEAAQRGGPAGIKPLGERNEFGSRCAEGALLPVTCVAGQHQAALVEALVARVGQIETVERDLRAEDLVGEELLEAGIGAAVGVEGRIAGIAQPGERGAGNAHRRGQKGDLAGSHLETVGLHLDAAEVELVDERVGLGEDRPRSLKCSVQRMPASSLEAT